MTGYGKHYLLNGDILTQPIQTQLSQNEKSFSQFFFSHIQNLYLIFNFFQREVALKADVFRKLRAPKSVVRYMSKKSSSRGHFDNQHGKWVETHWQYEREHLYHIYYSMLM